MRPEKRSSDSRLQKFMLTSISKNFGAQGLAFLVSILDRFIVVGILIRVWGPQTYAEWTLLLSTVGMLGLGELGLNIHNGNMLQAAHAVGDTDGFRRKLSIGLGSTLIVAAVLGLLGFVLLHIVDVPRWLSLSAIESNEAQIVLHLLLLAVVLRIARGGISQIYRGCGQFALGVTIDSVPIALQVAISLLLGYLGASPLAFATGYLASEAIGGWGFMTWDLSRRWPQINLIPRQPTRNEAMEAVRQIRWLGPLQGAPVAWLHLPIVILGQVGVTATALVSFTILRTLTNIIRQLTTMLAFAAGVEIAGSHYANSGVDTARQIEMTSRILSGIVVALSAGMMIFGDAFIRLWTGRNDLFDPVILAAFLGAAVIVAPAAPLASFGMYSSNPQPSAIASLVQLTLGLAIVAVLVSRFGAAGAAIGVAVAEAIALGIVLPALGARRVGINFPRHFGKCVAIMAVAALWCGGAGLAVRALIGYRTLMDLSLAVLLWSVIALAPTIAACLAFRDGTKMLGRSST